MSVKDLKNYDVLREKQRIANRYIKQARQRLGDDHRYVNSAINRISMFQKKIGKKPSARLSMTKLNDSTAEKYEVLLDSIIENTYINPEKYEEHREKQIEFAINEGWAKDRAEAEKVFSFANSELVAQLKDIGLGDIPSKIVEKYVKYMQGNMSEEEFINMATSFMSGYSKGDSRVEEFYDYADMYAQYHEQFEKIQEMEHQNGLDTTATFADWYKFGIYGSSDIDKAMSEYMSDVPMEDGFPMSFLSYFFEYYG